MLELKELHYQPATLDHPVLVDISLQVAAGRPALISGASGSGKTSLIDVISGLADAQAGSVSWCGCLLYTSPSPRDRQKSRMPSSA